MIATIYLPFLLYNEDVFHKEINTYDYVSYADTLINDYNKNKDVVNDYMNSGINSIPQLNLMQITNKIVFLMKNIHIVVLLLN